MDMQTNMSYDCVQMNTDDNIYEEPQDVKEPSVTTATHKTRLNSRKLTKKCQLKCFEQLVATVALLVGALALLLVSIQYTNNATSKEVIETLKSQVKHIMSAHTQLNISTEESLVEVKVDIEALKVQTQVNNATGEIWTREIRTLKPLLNSSNEALRTQISKLENTLFLLQTVQQQLNNTYQSSLQSTFQDLNQQLDAISQLHQNRTTKLQASLQDHIQVFEQQLNYSSQQILVQKTETSLIQTLVQQLNITDSEIRAQTSALQLQLSESVDLQRFLQEHVQSLQERLNDTNDRIILPKYTCKDLPEGSPSGNYLITTNSGFIKAYCDTNTRNCSCYTTVTGGWMRVANLDMTDPTQQCPDGFKLITKTEPPLRTCGRPDELTGCVSTTFPVHGIKYSRVCGRIIGYQIGSPSGFDSLPDNIDSYYVAGISLTHGQPRQHIWTFANALGEGNLFQGCPCNQGSIDFVPQIVGNDYFCDSAVRGNSATNGLFYPDDPLWDGQGCGSGSTCCEFNSPPWFCKQLPEPTTDDIEMRLCENNSPREDDSPFEVVEFYIN